ncbi:hypothetical protein SLA2020_491030 [Shorea laevis]
MVLLTHQLQGPYVAYPSRSLPWRKGLTLKRQVTTLCMVGSVERGTSVKHNICLSVETPHARGVKVRHFKVLAFKGSPKDESGSRASGSNIAKNSAKLSYVPKEGEETTIESPKAHKGPVAFASEGNETVTGSLAIQKLFQKWLVMLRSQSSSLVIEGVLGEELPPTNTSETCIETQSNKGGVLKPVWQWFWSLDSTIKIPLLIFIPMYLAVNVIYGTEVSKELTPLWVFGPLIGALYITAIKMLCALYIYAFKQTVKTFRYFAHGKFKEDLRARFWQPALEMKNIDYKELSKRKLKELQEWMKEKFIDYLEAMWPRYCKTIRYLKRVNFL